MMTSAKRVRSGGDRVPVSVSDVRYSSSASGAPSMLATVLSTAGRHAHPRQPYPFERCQFFTERRS